MRKGFRLDEPPLRSVPLRKAGVALVAVLHAREVEAVGQRERLGVDLRTADDEELLLLEKQGKKVYDSFLKLCNDPGFLQAIKSSDKKSFQIRFNYICDMLKEVLRGTKN